MRNQYSLQFVMPGTVFSLSCQALVHMHGLLLTAPTGAGCEVVSLDSGAVHITRDVEQENGSSVQEQFDIFLLVAERNS